MHPSCSALLLQAHRAIISLGQFQTTGTKEMSNLSAEEMSTKEMSALWFSVPTVSVQLGASNDPFERHA